MAELGAELRLEGQPRPDLRTRGEWRQQPLAGGSREIRWAPSGSPAGALAWTEAGLAFLILLVALPVVFRVTRDLDFLYNAPVIVPGGIPVDLDAAARRTA